MNVQQASRVVLNEARRKNTHEAGQHHQIGLVGIDGLNQRRIEGFAAVELLVVKQFGGDTGLLRPLQAVGIGAVGDNRGDASRIAVVGDAVDQSCRLLPDPEIRTTTLQGISELSGCSAEPGLRLRPLR